MKLHNQISLLLTLVFVPLTLCSCGGGGGGGETGTGETGGSNSGGNSGGSTYQMVPKSLVGERMTIELGTYAEIDLFFDSESSLRYIPNPYAATNYGTVFPAGSGTYTYVASPSSNSATLNFTVKGGEITTTSKMTLKFTTSFMADVTSYRFDNNDSPSRYDSGTSGKAYIK